MKRALLLIPLLAFLCLPAPVAAGENSFDLAAFEEVPVQSGGRVKPFSSLAREIVIFITGREQLEGRSAVTLLFEWLTRLNDWAATPLIPVSTPELRRSLGLPEGAKRVSPSDLAARTDFLSRAEEADARSSREESLTFLEKKELELYQKMNLFYNTAQGNTWSIVPLPGQAATRGSGEPGAKWKSIDSFAHETGLETFSGPFGRAVDAYLAGDQASFNQAARDYTTAVRGMNLPYLGRRVLGFDTLRLEVDYNHLRPFRWAWYAYLAGFLLLLVSLFWGRIEVPAYALLLGAFLLHTYGFFLRCAIAGRPPVSNMYESVIWVSWAAVLFSLALFTVYRSRHLVVAASALAAFGLVVADSFPAVLDPSIAPLVPVLRSNLWLTVHVLTITLSYGAFALALGIGHIQLFAYAFTPEKEEALRNLSQLLYRALQIGVVLLAAGTILGGVWANYSWGRFWGWDPKETWALIALLGYLSLLHGRFAGWLGPYGLAVGSVVAFQGILMAWYGVNFVLAAGLHSYGFGGGGVVYVLAAVAVDLALVGGLILAHRARRSKSQLAQ